MNRNQKWGYPHSVLEDTVGSHSFEETDSLKLNDLLRCESDGFRLNIALICKHAHEPHFVSMTGTLLSTLRERRHITLCRGIENGEDTLAKQMDFDYISGYFCYYPMSCEEFEKLV